MQPNNQARVSAKKLRKQTRLEQDRLANEEQTVLDNPVEPEINNAPVEREIVPENDVNVGAGPLQSDSDWVEAGVDQGFPARADSEGWSDAPLTG
jgi:hypothetical protein